jgi:hypothetical protein
MRTQAIKDFIREYDYLFWYTPEDKTEMVTDELLVETILNYGDLDAVRKLFAVFGLNNCATVFFNAITKSERSANNYLEIPRNYFKLYFNRYAQ